MKNITSKQSRLFNGQLQKNYLIDTKPAGYSWFIEKFNLSVMPHWHISAISTATIHKTISNNGIITDIYPKFYQPEETVGDHLEFALKYDGINLSYLSLIFNIADEQEILSYIKKTPTGKYARRIWFLFEFLTQKELLISDITQGNYIQLLEPDKYYTSSQKKQIKRFRVIDNLLGDCKFCPIIRRSEKLKKMDMQNFTKRCEQIIISYPNEILKRALSYLYKKETKSSFQIENINPDSSRAERFIGLLELAENQDFCDKNLLIELQNRTVEKRFANQDYRTDQNYVGQTVSYQDHIIHYISPSPEHLPELMEGLLHSHQIMKNADIPAIVHAAAVAYGFVFFHPFDDGNGRIHRFLIHNILAVQGVVPKGLMFPVSAVMLKNRDMYDTSLEAYSKNLIKLINYTLDDMGKLTVHNDVSCWYRYIDMTCQAESLYDFINITVETELAQELEFIVSYDKIKKSIQNLVDMPDRLIDLFIRLCLQNNKTLSGSKRASHFAFLTDKEVQLMEKAVQDNM